VTSFEVFDRESERAAAAASKGKDWVGLLSSDVAREGWTVLPSADEPSPLGSVVGSGPWTVAVPQPTLVAFAEDWSAHGKVWLNERFAFRPLADHAGRTVIIVPTGTHTLRYEVPQRLRNAAVWWSTSFLPAVIAFFLAWFLHRRLVRRPVESRIDVPAARPREFLLLALGVAIPWSWLLFTGPIANDYGWNQLTTEQAFGIEAPWFDHDQIPEALLLTTDSPIFRVVHHSLYALELLPFGPSGLWLHLIAVIYQILNGVLIFLLLRRWFPQGALIGAIVGAAWPVAGQALAWNAARCLPMAHTAGLLGLLLALRAMERHSALALGGAAACVWLAAGLKETGLAYGAVVGGVPLLLHARRVGWRPFVALYVGLLSVAVSYGLVRHLLGYGFPRGYHGVEFRSTWTTVLEGVNHLPFSFLGGLQWSHHRSGPVLFSIGRHDVDAWALAPFAMAAVLLLVALVRGGMKARVGLLLGVCTTALLALPDAVWLVSSRFVVGGRFYYIVPLLLWPLLIAAAASSFRATTPRLAQVRWGVAVAFFAAILWGHDDEGAFRHRMAKVGLQWIEGLGRTMDRMDQEVPASDVRWGHALCGPRASVIIGFPDRPHLGESPLLGVTVTGYVQPPYTQRPRHGDTFTRRTDAGQFVNRPSAIPALGHTLDAYPWPVWVFESAGEQQVPVYRGTLPALGAPMDEAVTLRSTSAESGRRSFTVPLQGRPLRAIGAVGLKFSEPLKSPFTIRWRVGTTEQAQILGSSEFASEIPGGADLYLPIRSMPLAALHAALEDVVVTVEGAEDALPDAVTARLVGELPSLQVLAPPMGTRVERGSPFPTLQFRDEGYAPAYQLRLTGHGVRAPAELNGTYIVPRSALSRDEAGVFTMDLMSHFGISPAVWNDSIAMLAARQPELAGLTVWLEIEGVAGAERLVQSRAEAIPIKIAY
jgi:hypothetical protein